MSTVVIVQVEVEVQVHLHVVLCPLLTALLLLR